MSTPTPKVDSPIPDTEKVDAEVTVLGFGNDDLSDRIERAQEDAKRQAEMPVKEALHKYRGAVLWSALMTLTIVMEGKSQHLTAVSSPIPIPKPFRPRLSIPPHDTVPSALVAIVELLHLSEKSIFRLLSNLG
jgi:hypothetical protein